MDTRFTSAENNQGKVIVARLLPDTDLISGLTAICKKHQIVSGYITTMIGSLKKARFIYAISDQQNKINIKYSDPVEVKGPLEFLSGQGIIGLDENKDINVHLHGLISDKKMQVYGGHFIQGGNQVLATMEIVIYKMQDISLEKFFDQETEFNLFNIYQK